MRVDKDLTCGPTQSQSPASYTTQPGSTECDSTLPEEIMEPSQPPCLITEPSQQPHLNVDSFGSTTHQWTPLNFRAQAVAPPNKTPTKEMLPASGQYQMTHPEYQAALTEENLSLPSELVNTGRGDHFFKCTDINARKED